MASAKEIQSDIDSCLYEEGFGGMDSWKYEDLVYGCMEARENKETTIWVKWDYEWSFDRYKIEQALRRKKWSVYNTGFAADCVENARRNGYIGHSREYGYSYSQVRDFFNSLSKNYDF
jgi:hypothetical protein